MYPVNTSKLNVTSKFGSRTYKYQGKMVSDYHHGIDLTGGSEIIAFADGEVTATCNVGEQYGQACYVRIKHSNGWYTLYYHLKSGSVCVKKGDKVKKSQKIGIMGTTGVSTGVHLHFQIDKGSSSSAIDPYDYVFNGKELVPSSSTTPSSDISKKSVDELAKEVIAGKYGNGDARRNALGSRYSEVQAKVNELLSGKSSSSTTTSETTIYTVVAGDNLTKIANKFGTSWQRLYDLNKKEIDNRAMKHGVKSNYYNFIYVGQVLRIK